MKIAAILFLSRCVLLHASWIDDKDLQRRTESRIAATPPRRIVDLDKAPEDRWAWVADDPLFANYAQDYHGYIGQYIPSWILPLVLKLVGEMDSKFYPDYAQEMRGLAKALRVTIGDVVLANLIYQLSGLSGNHCADSNVTGPCPTRDEDRAPGACTGVVVDRTGATGEEIWQGRNLDWNLGPTLLQYVLTIDYQRAGKTVFVASQIAGEIGVFNGMRTGVFSAQINARDSGGNILPNLVEQIMLGHKTPTHLMRRALEYEPTYAGAEKFLATAKLVNPVYFIMAGVNHGEGAILSRDRSSNADAWHLFEVSDKDKKHINPQPGWLRLQTNFDHWTPAPSYDNRRDPGVANTRKLCNASVSEACMLKIMTTWPTKNHHTDVTAIMCPKTGLFEVTVWINQTSVFIV